MLSTYATDKTLENEGTWCDLVRGGGKVKVARLNNPEYKKLNKKLIKPYIKIIRAGGEIPEEKNEEILIELFAHTIIRDWQITDPATGEALPYSYENVKALLQDSADFRDEVASHADNFDNFHKEALKEAAKN